MPKLWIQIENRPWDACPHNIDRMTGQDIMTRESGPAPAVVFLPSVNGGPGRNVTMFKPLRSGSRIIDALILRRYKPPTKPDGSDAWTVPDDRKVNPWDLNEPNPTENGTMGTIPGPTIEASVGDTITIYFRNKDHRLTSDGKPMSLEHRCHSLHPHGVVFEPTSDGAYPLSPPDPSQAVGTEASLWATVPGGGVTKFKKGDRVPPDATFTYTWQTFGWPTTAGVWLYHDHSICDDDNISLGAIGIIAIHNDRADPEQEVDPRNPADPSQLDPAFLPGGSPTGSPVVFTFFPAALGQAIQLLPHQLEDLVDHTSVSHEHAAAAATGAPAGGTKHAEPAQPALIFRQDDILLQVDEKFGISHFGFLRYRTPPKKLLTLQLFHALSGAPTCINGRQYLGNTPTIVSGPSTLMRFGVVGMGSDFHTFHIHGHRWTIPGPDGTTPAAIQSSAQVRAVSQFEDTRTFGPANSFVFTINGASGSFMRAGGPGSPQALGEWHMHCHVLMHMMTGMMGSLLIINGGEFATKLPHGVPCPSSDTPGPALPNTFQVTLQNFAFNPTVANIKVGDTVHWVWKEDNHSVTADDNSFDSGVQNNGATFDQMFMTAGTFKYYCKIHGGPNGAGMSGQVVVVP